MQRMVLAATIVVSAALAAGSATAQMSPYNPIGPVDMSVAQGDDFQGPDTTDGDWPPALSFRTRKFDVGLSPYASLDPGPRGGLATAGARIELSRPRDAGSLDTAAAGAEGRWYLFAATSGKALGLNLLRNDNGWDRGGWSAEPNSTLVGDAELGFGWRKGELQTSLGYRHREGRRKHTMFAQKTEDDSLLAISFSFRPGR
jgi:hypothetical protein